MLTHHIMPRKPAICIKKKKAEGRNDKAQSQHNEVVIRNKTHAVFIKQNDRFIKLIIVAKLFDW